jgi:hypothetical protein
MPFSITALEYEDFYKRPSADCYEKRAAPKNRPNRNVLISYGFGVAGGVGGVGLAWLAAASTIVRALL